MTLLRTRRWRAWAIVLALVGLGLLLVPQFNLLNYYFSLAVALVLPVAAGLVAVRAAADHRRARIGALLAMTLPAVGLLALIPLAAVLLGALWVQNCDWLQGLVHYLMGPVAGALLGAAAGLLAGRALPRRWATLSFVGLWSVLVGLNLAHFYLNPPIFAFNHFVGFFNGAVYDDLVQIDTRWATFRAISAGLALALLGLCAVSGRRRRSVLALGYGAVVVASLLPWFTLSSSAIAERLAGRYETEHFIIYYPAESDIAGRIELLAADHEFRYHQLAGELGVEPEGKVHSFIYASPDQKQELMGAGRTYIAKPWSREIHLNAIEVGAPVLKHELAHVFGGAINPGWLGIPTTWGLFPNMAVVEGFAVALTGERGRLTPHQWTAAMRELGIAPRVEMLFGATGFLATHSGQAYTVSGSLLRYLLDERGLGRFREFYRTGDLEAAYGEPLGALEEDWTAFLDDRDRVPLTDADRRLARHHFDAPSRFHRVCALEIAGWERAAGEAAASGRYGEALGLQRRIVDYDPSAVRRWALLEALILAGRLDEAARLAEDLAAEETASPVLRTRARIRSADLLWLRGEAAGAAERYRNLAAEEALDEAALRQVAITAASAGKPERAVVRDYLVDPRADEEEAIRALQAATERRPGDPILAYLDARRDYLEDDLDAADRGLARALTAGLAPEVLIREAHRLRGVIAHQQGRYRDAIAHFQAALPLYDSAGHRASVEDWIERQRWHLAQPR